MKKCIMTESAIEMIHRESQLAAGKETGGILIGPALTDSAIVITSATGPGKGKRTMASWETDPDFLNLMLKAAKDKNSLLNLRGFWHRHPGRMKRPSNQDLWEARQILTDVEHYKVGGELVMPIATCSQEQITISCYYITAQEPFFKEMPLEVVSDSDEMVEKLLSGRKVIGVEEEAEIKFWQDEKWQFYRSSYGAVRLEEELKLLENVGYKTAARLLDNFSCCIEVWKDGGRQRILFLLPREYPLNPPRVFVKYDKEIQEFGASNCSPLYRWSSEFYLAELMDTLMKQPDILRKQPGKHIQKRRMLLLEILVAMREDFRNGNCDISKLLRQFVRLIL